MELIDWETERIMSDYAKAKDREAYKKLKADINQLVTDFPGWGVNKVDVVHENYLRTLVITWNSGTEDRINISGNSVLATLKVFTQLLLGEKPQGLLE